MLIELKTSEELRLNRRIPLAEIIRQAVRALHAQKQLNI